MLINKDLSSGIVSCVDGCMKYEVMKRKKNRLTLAKSLYTHYLTSKKATNISQKFV